MTQLWDNFTQLLERGGLPVMIMLMVLSVAALAMVLTQFLFWLLTHGLGRKRSLAQLMQTLHKDDIALARQLALADSSVYGAVAQFLLDSAPAASIEDGEALAIEAIESQRPRIERFMTALTTIITVAPMLGILGTVVGLMHSLGIWSDQVTSNDPRTVASGIAEALITTATGLVIAIVVLFPYNYFRVQVDRCLSRLETLSAACLSSLRRTTSGPSAPQQNMAPTEPAAPQTPGPEENQASA
jgi:biopolymer transport protein ExbB